MATGRPIPRPSAPRQRWSREAAARDGDPDLDPRPRGYRGQLQQERQRPAETGQFLAERRKGRISVTELARAHLKVTPTFVSRVEKGRTKMLDAKLRYVSALGPFDYLSDRFAIFGTPEDCRAQLLRAQKVGLERVMFTVSLASDPLATVELFGRKVLPAFQ